MKTISVIIACYNEEESLPLYFEAVDKVIPTLKDYKLEFILVNDGSKDNTLKVMEDLNKNRNDIIICSLSRNYGQNAAFSAGLKISKGDYCIMMDSDLQDPVELIPEIAQKFDEGYDVVNPHRVDRSSDSAFKRDTAGLFYRIINKLEGKKVIPENVNCFRGLSRKVVDHIVNLTEKDRCILSEVPLIGYKTTYIDFTRQERKAGQSKYNLKKMVLYAFDNMANITARPLYLIAMIGGALTLLSLLLIVTFLVFYILSYPSIHVVGAHEVFTLLFVMSFITFGVSIIIDFIGVIAIYLHNILINTRNRPTYIIDFVKDKEKVTHE